MKRSEAEKKYTWATEDLFPSDEAWENACEDLKKEVEVLVSYKGELGKDGKTLLEYLKKSEDFNIHVTSVYTYAMFKSDEDKSNSVYMGMIGKAMSLITSLSESLSFETPEIVAIDDATMEKFYKETEGLEHFRRAITRQRAYREHTLSEAEEKLLAAAGEMSNLADNTHSILTNADMKFHDIKGPDGEDIKVTSGTFIKLMESPDINIRKQAFESVYSAYAALKNTMATLFDGQVVQQKFFTKARKYSSNMERALFRTEVPTSVYHNLIDTVNKRLPLLHRYMALRKKLLGVDELHMYDLYTPLIPEADMKVDFEKAKELALEALKPLGETYLSYIKEGFANRWIDVYENEGKRGGAYSCGTPVHPFVLLNHSDNLDSAFTLVHEMGHAIHSYLSNKHQSPAYSEYVIFVAEVASTFNESLLMKYLLSVTEDKKQRAYLINYFLEQFRTTLYRQTMFAEFEMMMNEAGERGETLTADMLCDMYYDLNKKYYGDAMVVDKEISYEWERIPHFFMNFYVYQYSTGFSAAMALSDKVVKNGKPAVDAYLNFLSSGCISDPITLLRGAGVDMATPAPIEAALDIFESLIDEMEKLV